MYGYSPMTRDDLRDAVMFYETYLNAGACVKRRLGRWLGDGAYAGYVCRGADGSTAGMASALPGVHFTTPHPRARRAVLKRCADGPVYTLDMIAVAGDQRHNGISRALADRLVPDLIGRGARYLAMELWILPDGRIPAEAAFFPRWGETVYLEDFSRFYEDLPRYGMTCPLCGGDCACGARVRVIRLPEAIPA